MPINDFLFISYEGMNNFQQAILLKCTQQASYWFLKYLGFLSLNFHFCFQELLLHSEHQSRKCELLAAWTKIWSYFSGFVKQHNSEIGLGLWFAVQLKYTAFINEVRHINRQQ